MSFRFEIDASGAINGLERIAKGIPAAKNETFTKEAEDIIRGAKSIVPVRTGRLQRSIGILSQSDLEWRVGTDLFYAYVVEFGNFRTPGRAYIGPQYDMVRNSIIPLLITNMRRFF